MKIISPQWTNLSKGYQAARALERQARQNWELKWANSVDFARQQGLRRAAEMLQAQVRDEKRTLRFILVLLAALILAMAILSLLAENYPQLRWLILPVGVMNVLQALVLLLPIYEKLKTIAELSAAEPTPEEPGASLEITEQWWQAVSGQDALESDNAAAAGEIAFLKYLAANLPNDYFAVRSPLIRHGLGVDILLFGPTGVWLFVVRHWQGRVFWRNGIWQPETSAPDAQGAAPVAPDSEWLRGRQIVEKMLNARLAKNANLGAILHGGVVFTHPFVQLDAGAGVRVPYGTPPQWLQRIRSAQNLSRFTTEVQLLVFDVLFDYALGQYVTRPLLRSAVELAKVLYGDVLEDLRQYIVRQVRSKMAR